MTKITPKSGTLHCIPYESDSTFRPAKTSAGDIQMSEVVAVGDKYIDDNGTYRYPNCKAGDIIIHEYTPHTGEVEFTEHRFVKFWQVLATIEEKTEK